LGTKIFIYLGYESHLAIELAWNKGFNSIWLSVTLPYFVKNLVGLISFLGLSEEVGESA